MKDASRQRKIAGFSGDFAKNNGISMTHLWQHFVIRANKRNGSDICIGSRKMRRDHLRRYRTELSRRNYSPEVIEHLQAHVDVDSGIVQREIQEALEDMPEMQRMVLMADVSGLHGKGNIREIKDPSGERCL
jgi:hypothetical protein